MRILIHDYAGHPFQVQLSRELARRGHQVRHIYCASFQSPRGALTRRESDPAGFEIDGVSLGEPIAKYSFLRRYRQERRYGKLLEQEVSRFQPDLVLSSNTPPDAQQVLQRSCRKRGVRFYYWLQDVYSEGVARVLRPRLPLLWRPVAAHYRHLEQGLLARSDGVVIITKDFHVAFDWSRVQRERVHIIENWAPLDEVPLRPKDNPWSRAHGLEDKLCFLYSGTLGLKHNPDLLLQLAVSLKDRPECRVVVVSSGLGADWLRERGRELGLENLLILDFQPFEDLPDVLGSADLLLAILEPDAGIFSVPSKVLTYMCAGRALVLGVPEDNLAARIVVRNGAGRIVDPRDVRGFVQTALQLADDTDARQDCGRNGRAYAESTFDIDRIADQFEEVLGVV